MFGFPDGQLDILKGKIADYRISYLARQREMLDRKCIKEVMEIEEDNDRIENEDECYKSE